MLKQLSSRIFVPSRHSFFSGSEWITYYRQSILPALLVKSNFFRNRNLFWSNYTPLNFGDWISPYLFYKMTQQAPFYQPTSRYAETIYACGSILRHIKKSESAVVWGSGAISIEDVFCKPKSVRAVRGPMSREVLTSAGVSCPDIFGDPAILLPLFYFPRAKSKRFRIGIIPHYIEYEKVSRLLGRLPCDYQLIDVTAPIEQVVDQIFQCDATISSSLHGVIVSHSYGVPCCWSKFSFINDNSVFGDGFKFFDYFSAFDGFGNVKELVVESPKDIFSSSFYEMLIESKVPTTSSLVPGLLDSCPF